MKLPFLDRREEAARFRRLLDRTEGSLGVVARASVPLLHPGGRTWGAAGRWWGPGLDRQPLEVDLVAYSLDGGSVLVGEVKWAAPRDAERLLAQLEAKARRLPVAAGKEVVPALWLKAPVEGPAANRVVTPRQVLDVLR
ncbi:MAG TPA: DUF234 domain-containing protein [Thermoanaerobaculia bacterium]|nr:DUF234 domain-containing protein [Thermoanaerobaculia bacterium]